MRQRKTSILAAVAFAAATFTSASAFALAQSKHQQISRDACEAAGLPEEFCERVGVEAFDVDAYEWTDLAAHAQIDTGQTACEAADLAADRVYGLGQDVRETAFAIVRGAPGADATHLATALGRALHTVQDNCAHSGISNPNHAWLSFSDTCSGTTLSPDVQPEAIACAERETAVVITAFEAALTDAGLPSADLGNAAHGWPHWPSRDYVCAWMRSGATWSGLDTRWDNAVVVPALRAQIVAGLGGAAIDHDVCHGDPHALDATQPAVPVDTSHGQSSCAKVDLYCVGESAATDGAPPPWEEPASAASSEVTGGCAAGRESPIWLALIVVALLALRRGR